MISGSWIVRDSASVANTSVSWSLGRSSERSDVEVGDDALVEGAGVVGVCRCSSLGCCSLRARRTTSSWSMVCGVPTGVIAFQHSSVLLHWISYQQRRSYSNSTGVQPLGRLLRMKYPSSPLTVLHCTPTRYSSGTLRLPRRLRENVSKVSRSHWSLVVNATMRELGLNVTLVTSVDLT